ncbi:MAG: hypothetical protein LBV33_01440, partial [Lachnospiraceae bacterium]|nr:hypothetical protein [Lachnospiraceae bacterium]
MAVYSNISKEFLQIVQIVTDLTAGVPERLSENAIGFLMCDSQVDYQGVVGLLNGRLAIPIVGGTTFTDPLGSEDEERSASLTILELEEGACSVKISEPLSAANIQQMDQLYQECVGGLRETPKLLMMFV